MWEQIVALSPLRKLLVFLLASAVLDGASYFLFVESAQSEVKGLQQRIRRAERELDEIRQSFTEERLAEIEQETADLREQVEESEKLLPRRDEIPEFLQKVKGHADTSGLTVVRFDTEQKVYKTDYAMIPIRMDVIGDTVERVKFFRTLAEPQERLVNVAALNIKTELPGRRAVMEVEADKELDRVEQQLRSAKQLERVNSELAAKVERILDLERVKRLSRIRATFTVNAFTFLSEEERAKLNERRR